MRELVRSKVRRLSSNHLRRVSKTAALILNRGLSPHDGAKRPVLPRRLSIRIKRLLFGNLSGKLKVYDHILGQDRSYRFDRGKVQRTRGATLKCMDWLRESYHGTYYEDTQPTARIKLEISLGGTDEKKLDQLIEQTPVGNILVTNVKRHNSKTGGEWFSYLKYPVLCTQLTESASTKLEKIDKTSNERLNILVCSPTSNKLIIKFLHPKNGEVSIEKISDSQLKKIHDHLPSPRYEDSWTTKGLSRIMFDKSLGQIISSVITKNQGRPIDNVKVLEFLEGAYAAVGKNCCNIDDINLYQTEIEKLWFKNNTFRSNRDGYLSRIKESISAIYELLPPEKSTEEKEETMHPDKSKTKEKEEIMHDKFREEYAKNLSKPFAFKMTLAESLEQAYMEGKAKAHGRFQAQFKYYIILALIGALLGFKVNSYFNKRKRLHKKLDGLEKKYLELRSEIYSNSIEMKKIRESLISLSSAKIYFDHDFLLRHRIDLFVIKSKSDELKSHLQALGEESYPNFKTYKDYLDKLNKYLVLIPINFLISNNPDISDKADMLKTEVEKIESVYLINALLTDLSIGINTSSVNQMSFMYDKLYNLLDTLKKYDQAIPRAHSKEKRNFYDNRFFEKFCNILDTLKIEPMNIANMEEARKKTEELLRYLLGSQLLKNDEEKNMIKSISGIGLDLTVKVGDAPSDSLSLIQMDETQNDTDSDITLFRTLASEVSRTISLVLYEFVAKVAKKERDRPELYLEIITTLMLMNCIAYVLDNDSARAANAVAHLKIESKTKDDSQDDLSNDIELIKWFLGKSLSINPSFALPMFHLADLAYKANTDSSNDSSIEKAFIILDQALDVTNDPMYAPLMLERAKLFLSKHDLKLNDILMSYRDISKALMQHEKKDSFPNLYMEITKLYWYLKLYMLLDDKSGGIRKQEGHLSKIDKILMQELSPHNEQDLMIHLVASSQDVISGAGKPANTVAIKENAKKLLIQQKEKIDQLYKPWKPEKYGLYQLCDGAIKIIVSGSETDRGEHRIKACKEAKTLFSQARRTREGIGNKYMEFEINKIILSSCTDGSEQENDFQESPISQLAGANGGTNREKQELEAECKNGGPTV